MYTLCRNIELFLRNNANSSTCVPFCSSGNLTDIYRVDMQYYSSSYYTATYYMQYSLDGNDYYDYTDYTGTRQVSLVCDICFSTAFQVRKFWHLMNILFCVEVQ